MESPLLKRVRKAPFSLYQNWAHVEQLTELVASPLDPSISLPGNLHEREQETILLRCSFVLEELMADIVSSIFSPENKAYVDDIKLWEWIDQFGDVIGDWHHQIAKVLLYLHKSRTGTKPERITKPSPCVIHLLDSGAYDGCSDMVKEACEELVSKLANAHRHYHSFVDYDGIKGKLLSIDALKPLLHDSTTPAQEKYFFIQRFFRGFHQVSEIAFLALDSLYSAFDEASSLVKTYFLELASENIPLSGDRVYLSAEQFPLFEHAQVVQPIMHMRKLLFFAKAMWDLLSNNMRLFCSMDAIAYSEYRVTLTGTSGADSIMLRRLKAQTSLLLHRLPWRFKEQDMPQVYNPHTAPTGLYGLMESTRELLRAASGFWLEHFNLAANTIGLSTEGSQGVPVDHLISFAVRGLYASPLLRLISDFAAQHQKETAAENIMTVKYAQGTRRLGATIAPYAGDNAQILTDVVLDTGKKYLLDLFILSPVQVISKDLSSADLSPYRDWFDMPPSQFNMYFNNHGVGRRFLLAEGSAINTVRRVNSKGVAYMEVIYMERFPEAQSIVFKHFGINAENGWQLTMGSSVTEFLLRLLSTPYLEERQKTAPVVVTTDNEFVTVKRGMASFQHYRNFEWVQAHVDEDMDDLSTSMVAAIQAAGDRLSLVCFAACLSNRHLTFAPSEIMAIVAAVPETVPIIIDLAQHAFNVPMQWGDILGQRKNVYLVGSCVKYGRGGEGLGFMVHPFHGLLAKPVLSGWTSYLTGLDHSVITDGAGELAFDAGLEWQGGTPVNFVNLEILINSWDAVSRSLETLQSLHAYTMGLTDWFTENLKALLPANSSLRVYGEKRRVLHRDHASSTLVLVDMTGLQKLHEHLVSKNVVLDCREHHYIRIGFGIEHGLKDVQELLRLILSYYDVVM